MRLVRHLNDYHPQGPVALAIGNFDGVHAGHRAVIAQMLQQASAQRCNGAVLIFEPQPLEYLCPTPPQRLYSLRDKLSCFAALGVDLVFCLKFDRALSSLEPERFVAKLLHERLDACSVTVGSRFNFGYLGRGDYQCLKDNCAVYGIRTLQVTECLWQGERISSSLLRSLLSRGQLEQARELLGAYYSISCRVGHGDGIGRQLGFPTANLIVGRRLRTLRGVFAVLVADEQGRVYEGMANVGVRPSAPHPEHPVTLEVNLFDFQGSLYGAHLQIYFVARLRDERTFAALDELTKQLEHDRSEARALLSRCAGVGNLAGTD
ncbi:MAG: riboflavin biosynthesis protein RibF [Succinivibrio sp.]|nr:riboflavin biosynthesis protein RibF [Succinivibrio sp.]